MSLFSENLRLLRTKTGLSQKSVAAELIITRERLAKYEDGRSEPPFDVLKRISKFHHVSIDILLSVDLSRVSLDSLLRMDDNRILLPITVDKFGNDNIEVIPHTAKAGYLSGYSDPEFIENLQHISLPFLGNGKYRAFPVEGDSMPPHKEGSFIVGRYIERLGDVLDGKTYILLTRNQGIVYKRLNRNGKNELVLHSDNSYYEPYQIKASEILEIWEYASSIATKEFLPDDLGAENVKSMFNELKREIASLKRPN